MRFSALQRLRKAEDFKVLQQNGQKIHCKHFIFIAKKRDSSSLINHSRIGIIASRKVGNAAVRNRAKRIFREIFRLNQDLLPHPTDILIILRSSYIKESYEELENRFIKACKSLSVH